MSEKKAPLKERDPYRYYANQYAALMATEYGCIVAPMAGVFIAKWEEYFQATDGSATKLTIGCVLALVMSAVFLYKQRKHQEEVEGKKTMLTYVMWVGVVFAFSFLFKSVLDDLTLIAGVELGGAVAAYCVDLAAQSKASVMKAAKESKLRAEADKAYRN